MAKVHTKDGLTFERVKVTYFIPKEETATKEKDEVIEKEVIRITKYMDSRCMFAPQFQVDIPLEMLDSVGSELMSKSSKQDYSKETSTAADVPEGGHVIQAKETGYVSVDKSKDTNTTGTTESGGGTQPSVSGGESTTTSGTTNPA